MLKKWPPAVNWFVSFDYFSTQTEPAPYYGVIAAFSKKGTKHGDDGNRLIFLERSKDRMQMKTYVEMNNDNLHTVCYRDLGFAANEYVTIRIQQKKHGDGIIKVTLFLNGAVQCTEKNAASQKSYENVHVWFQGSNSPQEPEVVVKNFEFGELLE